MIEDTDETGTGTFLCIATITTEDRDNDYYRRWHSRQETLTADALPELLETMARLRRDETYDRGDESQEVDFGPIHEIARSIEFDPAMLDDTPTGRQEAELVAAQRRAETAAALRAQLDRELQAERERQAEELAAQERDEEDMAAWHRIQGRIASGEIDAPDASETTIAEGM